MAIFRRDRSHETAGFRRDRIVGRYALVSLAGFAAIGLGVLLEQLVEQGIRTASFDDPVSSADLASDRSTTDKVLKQVAATPRAALGTETGTALTRTDAPSLVDRSAQSAAVSPTAAVVAAHEAAPAASPGSIIAAPVDAPLTVATADAIVPLGSNPTIGGSQDNVPLTPVGGNPAPTIASPAPDPVSFFPAPPGPPAPVSGPSIPKPIVFPPPSAPPGPPAPISGPGIPKPIVFPQPPAPPGPPAPIGGPSIPKPIVFPPQPAPPGPPASPQKANLAPLISQPGQTAFDPIMPQSTAPDGTVTLPLSACAGATCNNWVYVDPIVAIGYNYELKPTNPNQPLTFGITDIRAVTKIGNGHYDLFLLDTFTGQYVDAKQEIDADPNGSFSLVHFLQGLTPNQDAEFGVTDPTRGLTQFSLRGIDPSAGVDPNDPNAFITGLMFLGPIDGNLFITPLVIDSATNLDPTFPTREVALLAVSEPNSGLLFGFGLLGAVFLMRCLGHRKAGNPGRRSRAAL
jgi:hypothetical protein